MIVVLLSEHMIGDKNFQTFSELKKTEEKNKTNTTEYFSR